MLGPALPYIRSAEHISYLVGALHQVAFSIGGGIAGALSARDRIPFRRRAIIAAGLAGGALAALAVGYGDSAPMTISAALLMGLLATSALIRLWAALADAHGSRRAVAMTEGEVAVSLAGIATPLLLGALAASWRLAFVIGVVTATVAVTGVLRTEVPPPHRRPHLGGRPRRAGIQATLVIVFAIVALEFSLSFWLASYLNDDVGLARDTAVGLVSVLYAANLAGRLLASRLARAWAAESLLFAALGSVLAGLPFLLIATGAAAAVTGIVLAGAGIGALFPLTSALHVEASGRMADSALGEILTVGAAGQIAGPLVVAALAQATNLRMGLLFLPALTLLAAAGLTVRVRPAARRSADELPGRPGRFNRAVVLGKRGLTGVRGDALQAPRPRVQVEVSAEPDPLTAHAVSGRVKQHLNGAVVHAALVIAAGICLLGPRAGDDLAVLRRVHHDAPLGRIRQRAELQPPATLQEDAIMLAGVGLITSPGGYVLVTTVPDTGQRPGRHALRLRQRLSGQIKSLTAIQPVALVGRLESEVADRLAGGSLQRAGVGAPRLPHLT